VAAASAWLLLGPLREGRRIADNEEQALADLREFASLEATLSSLNAGGFVAPEVLADSEKHPSLVVPGRPLASATHARFGEPERDGYRFLFRPDPASRMTAAPVSPAWRSYAYVALPLDPGRTGRRSFALLSRTGAIHVRYDASPPGEQDPVVTPPR